MADQYDQTVQVSNDNNLYPFAGYKEIVNTIFNEAMQNDNSAILDIGFGTGVLTSRLYDNGHQIYGVDFSSKMILIARDKMPNATLIEGNIKQGLPPALLDNKYDSIISTYALHHLTDVEKIEILINLLPLLNDGGKILIGDIAFETREQLELCRLDSINYWDDDEFYFVTMN